MSSEHSMRRVTAIRNGTVIDHVPSGQALRVLEMLGIGGNTSVPVSLVMNVPSKKMGSKDIIKVEDRELTQAELDRLALVAPDAHVAIIRAYSVAEKLTINLGDEVVNVVRCTFPIALRPTFVNLYHIDYALSSATRCNYVVITVVAHKTWTNLRTMFYDSPFISSLMSQALH